MDLRTNTIKGFPTHEDHMSVRKLFLGVAFLLLVLVSPALAERPIGPRLLPERTVAMVRIRSFPESRAKFSQTAMGKILTDPEVGPLVSKLYEQGQEMYKRVEEQVGVPLEKLLALPQGEIWVAVVPPVKDGPVSLALLIDVGNQLPTATRLIERGEEVLKENGGRKVQETVVGEKVSVFLPPGVGEPRRELKRDKDGKEYEEIVVENGTMVQFERDGAIVVTSTLTLAEEILKSLSDSDAATLAENERFGAVMNRCVVGKDPPGFEWYVDPIATVKALFRGNAGAQVGLAILPALGLDGIQAAGGTMTFATGEFDGVAHTHLLLEDPKSGVMELVQMASGDSTPQPWVPGDVMTYMTLNWDFQETWKKGTKVYDGFFGEGNLAKELNRRAENALGVSFENELLPALAGRVTYIQWNEPPARINSGAQLFAIQLADAKAFEPTLEKIMAKYPERLEKKSFGANTYFQIKLPQGRVPDLERENIRMPEPCIAIVGDYVLLADSVKFFEHCITTMSTGKSLAGELEYQLIATKIGQQAGGKKPGLVIFSQPEEGLRAIYNLATSEVTRRNMAREAERGNEFFKRLDETLKERPLPPFAVISKYLAPSGGMMTQDETGLHYMSFTLKRK